MLHGGGGVMVDAPARPFVSVPPTRDARVVQYGALGKHWGKAVIVIPDFVDVAQSDRVLPVGIHQATLPEVEDRFVRTAPTSRRRADLWNWFVQFTTLVNGIVPIDQIFLDGSFVTSRVVPKDTDFSMWIQAAAINALAPSQRAAFDLLMSQRITHYHCDAYLVTPCAPADPEYAFYQYWKNRTEASWPAYKNRAKLIIPGVAKGYIEVVT